MVITHYDTLEINTDASSDDIRKAYKRMAQKHHPDKGGSHEDFVKIKIAYDTLSNPELRQQYDDELLKENNPNRKKEEESFAAEFEKFIKIYTEIMDGNLNNIKPNYKFIYYMVHSDVSITNVLMYLSAHLISGDFTPENLVEEAKIISVKQYYIPTYYFYGEYKANWSAEFGYSRLEKYPTTEYVNGKEQTVWKTQIVYDWYPRFGSVSGEFRFCVSAIDKSSYLSKTVDLFNKGFKYSIRNSDINEMVRDASVSSSNAFSGTGKPHLKSIIDEDVMSCAQGDDQRSWDFDYSAKIRQKTMLFPVFRCIFEYKNKQYEVCINGADPEIIKGDPLPIDEKQKDEANYGFILFFISLISSGILINFFGFNLLIVGNIIISLISALLRKEYLINASKELRSNKLNMTLNQATQDAVISSQKKKITLRITL